MTGHSLALLLTRVDKSQIKQPISKSSGLPLQGAPQPAKLFILPSLVFFFTSDDLPHSAPELR